MKILIFILFLFLLIAVVFAYDSELDNLQLTGTLKMNTDQQIYFGDGQENYIKGNSTQVAMCGPTFCFIAK